MTNSINTSPNQLIEHIPVNPPASNTMLIRGTPHNANFTHVACNRSEGLSLHRRISSSSDIFPWFTVPITRNCSRNSCLSLISLTACWRRSINAFSVKCSCIQQAIVSFPICVHVRLIAWNSERRPNKSRSNEYGCSGLANSFPSSKSEKSPSSPFSSSWLICNWVSSHSFRANNRLCSFIKIRKGRNVQHAAPIRTQVPAWKKIMIAAIPARKNAIRSRLICRICFFTRINSFVVSVIRKLYQSLGVVINIKVKNSWTNVVKEKLFYNLQILNTWKIQSICNHTPLGALDVVIACRKLKYHLLWRAEMTEAETKKDRKLGYRLLWSL